MQTRQEMTRILVKNLCVLLSQSRQEIVPELSI